MTTARDLPNADFARPFGAPIDPIRFDVSDLDAALSPRDDLDAFVNSRWRAATAIPPDRSCWDAFSILAERTLRVEAEIASGAASSQAPRGSAECIVGDFWASGMADDGDAGPLDAELARIDALDDARAIAVYLGDRHARGWDVVFDLDAAPDFADPHRTIAFVGQGGLGLPDRDDYFDATPRGMARRHAYTSHIAAMLDLAGAGRHAALADDVFAFETELAEASLSRRQIKRDIGTRYDPIDTADADKTGATFSWNAFFATLGIDAPTTFSLAPRAFHARVADLLERAPPAVWRAYLRYHTIDDAAPYLGDAFARQHHAFHADALRAQAQIKPRWKRVLGAIDAHVGEAMGRLIVESAFAPRSKRQVAAIAERLRDALRSRLERIEWMSDATRANALSKLAALDIKIGYPDRWRDWSGLATTRRGLLANVLAARAFERRDLARRIGRPTDRSRWPMPPQTVNAGYDPQRNELVFPAAILAPPFFDADADDALNYGGIGAVIAHEMIHGFDDQGSRFGPDGRFENWWSEADRARFETIATRLVDEFDRHATDCGERIDGALTLGENIADFGGLAVACDALRMASASEPDPMRDGYTRLQRFFFGWAAIWRQKLTLGEARFRLRADSHAPASTRANLAAAHLPAFAEAFACEPGDRMQRSDQNRVRLW